MADIDGKPMLRHVLERCGLVRGVKAVVACSDSELVIDAVRS
jgi:3-deoxy-manno-octulosonate cytidylyltransferase (CMP-KDO synthetase)